jgi:hypothetical protein
LEWKWRNPINDEEVLEFEKIATKKHKRAIYEPFKDE